MKQGRYEYQEVIGEGGMAKVYKGIQKSLNRPVAIKVLSGKLSDNPSVIKRFQRESLIIARLNHPNIIHVIDKGMTSKGRPVFVMEFVEGKTLGEQLHSGKMTFNHKVDTIIQLCKGLAYAHKLGVVHRDIKPANVIIDHEGNARILDFGIASFFEDDKESKDEESRLVMGTESYMAPEQRLGLAETTTLSDVYSLGVVIYEMFTGNVPAKSSVPASRYEKKLAGEFDHLISRMLSHDQADRPQSMEEVKNTILRTMQGQHINSEQQARAGEGMASIRQKFGLLDVVKEDGNGAVYLFEEKQTHNLLIIKKRKGSTAGLKEAKMFTRIKHTNIVNIFGSSRKEKMFIVVMEYLGGGNLQDQLIEPFTLGAFLRIANQICNAMCFAHQQRIYHGNLRPGNILFAEDGTAKVSDFGFDEHYRYHHSKQNWYAYPNEYPGELSDIYSLGAIFFHMLTGRPPHRKDGKLVLNRMFAELDQTLQDLLLRMLESNPEKRPQSVEAVQSEFFLLQDDEPTVLSSEPMPKTIKVRQAASPVKPRSWLIIVLIMLLISLSVNIYCMIKAPDILIGPIESILTLISS
jgi:serine/threonine-protein kinase